MQREYIEGIRPKYQKPFSMFFICATFAAISLYWINLSLIKYFDSGDSQEAIFFDQYWVLLQVYMLPVYSFITYLVFKEFKFNYAEIIVFQLYLGSFLFILLVFIHLFKFISPEFETRYIELPAILLYTVITNFYFFQAKSKLILLIKSFIAIAIGFFLATYIQDVLVEML